jgi:tetraacyldisaccharide 4'-kinase
MSLATGSRRAFLAPLGGLVGLAALARRAAYRRGLLRQARLEGPVISVGNLSVGGSGKTPVVAAIATLLREAGHPVAILSRGYRGAFAGTALIVSDGEHLLADAASGGDEPVMLARELPGVVIAVGRRRDAVGRAVEARFGARVHILDDGFQHLRLARDLDVVCLAAEDVGDWPLPAGRLREFGAAARGAQAVLVSGDEALVRAVRERLGHEGVFALKRRALGFFERDGRPRPAPLRPFLFCGIARPARFMQDVATLSSESAGQAVYRDHHAFSASEIVTLARRARAAGADALVTTAKDVVRLPEVSLDLPLVVLKISVSVEPESSFRRLLLATAARAGKDRGR